MDENGVLPWNYLDNNSGQDMGAWVTQGDIADRTGENLGRSDKGVILYRRMLEQNIRIVEDGGDPMNTFRDPATNVYLPMDTETNARFFRGGARRQRGGAASKYSPILIQREGEVKY
jgi:5,5'-dehydrodivanillate O-demethylase